MSIGWLASRAGLVAALIGTLEGLHGRWDEAIGAALIVVVCATAVALWGE